jgi:hypothetical protein
MAAPVLPAGAINVNGTSAGALVELPVELCATIAEFASV